MNELPWILLFLPLLAAVLIALFTQKDQRVSAALSVAAVAAGFVLSLVLFAGTSAPWETKLVWLRVSDLQVDFGLRLDPLSLLMLLIVTGVGSAIHLYSAGYMRGDPGYSRFFACLSLFVFSMLGVVLSDNFLQMFIFWELVGVSSYLLIGFWYARDAAADAAKKAFLTNRVGDFGFLCGIILVWSMTGTLNFEGVKAQLQADPQLFGAAATAVGLLIFCGAAGKSAQFPLHVWLPDAMEGPTPVSALIHAATMVAAGVYMLCRVFFLFNLPALTVIAWIGGITSLMAAMIAVQQDDIKRILAYSTLSQLGYMVMAVGLQSPPAAMFHLATHAFFKALLFLAAGSVIHVLHHEQNIWKMGGLGEKMPVTFWTFLIATLALCGCPPFSGFYSKDAILATAYEHNLCLFVLGIMVAVLTTFYMFRLFFVAVLGRPKSDAAHHAHESPKVMTLPLIVLATASVVGGFLGIEQFIAVQFGEEAAPLFAPLGPFAHSPLAAAFGLLAVFFGFSLAAAIYAGAESDPLPGKLQAIAAAMRDKFYFDELYAKLISMTQDALARFADAVDRWIVGGLVRLVHGSVEFSGRGLRLFQTGSLQTYAFLFAAGLAVVLFFALL